MTTPSRDEYTQWGTSHFDALANALRTQIEQSSSWANSHLDMIRNPGGTEWTGKGADAAAGIAEQAVNTTKGRINAAQDLIGIAERGRDSVRGAMSKLNDAISTAEQEGFEVTSNWSVIPTGTWDSSTLNTAAKHADNIGYHLKSLVDTDSAIHGELTKKATELDGLRLPRPKGKDGVELVSNTFKENGPGGDDPKPDPKIIGIKPTTDPQAFDPLPPGQTPLTDLNDTTPDWDHTVTGDGLHSPPLVDGQPTPIHPPKAPGDHDPRRALPTGVGRDANGNVIVGVATPQYQPNGTNAPDEFTTKDTQVWNFADPKNPVQVGTLTDKSQASVYYNSAEKQWVVVGNDGPQPGAQRHIWTAPVDPTNPNGNSWMNNLTDRGVVPGGGDRENQYIPLRGGGTLLVDAGNNQGVQLYTAATTEGLTAPGATPVPLAQGVSPAIQPPLPDRAPPGSTWNFSAAYGATVTNDVVHGNTETVTVRVSTWGQVVPPPGVQLPPELAGNANNYFPRTLTYNVEIQH